jgi:hypothetical protein
LLQDLQRDGLPPGQGLGGHTQNAGARHTHQGTNHILQWDSSLVAFNQGYGSESALTGPGWDLSAQISRQFLKKMSTRTSSKMLFLAFLVFPNERPLFYVNI